MKKRLQVRGTLIVGLLLAIVLAACAPAAPAKPTTIRLGQVMASPSSLTLWTARDKGYFRDENLTVEVISLSSGDKMISALISGSIEIALQSPDWLIRAVEKGEAGIKIGFGGNNVPVYSLVVPKEVKSYADLKGKRIAVSNVKAADAYFTRRMMTANGLKEADYSLIAVGGTTDRAAALKAGSVAASLLIPPFDQVVIDEGYSRLDITSKVIKQYAWNTGTIKEDWAKANKAAFVGFLRAWAKATRWVYDPKNKEEAIQLIVRELKIEEKYARPTFDLFLEAKHWPKDGEMDMGGLQAVMDTMVEQGDLTPPLPKPEKYVNLTYWQEAVKSLK